MNNNLLARTLQGERTDFVPVAPFIHTNYVDEFFSQSKSDPISKTIEVYQYYGFDVILRNCTADYLDEKWCDSKNWRVTTEEKVSEPGINWQVTTRISTPERVLQQIKKYNKASEFEVVEAITEYYIKDEDDFVQFLKYQPAVPRYDMTNVSRARDMLAGNGLVAPWAQGAFNMASMYRKLEDLLTDPYSEDDLYEKMMDYFSGRMLEVISQYIQAGADMISCGGNVANGRVVGPGYFSKYIIPYESNMAARVKEMGAYHLYHNCGYSGQLLPLYSQIGMNLYETLTPEPYGDTSLESAISAFDKKITLSGNIDQITLLRKGSADTIEQAVKETLFTAKKRGNFILATTDYFNEQTPEKNIVAFAEAARKYGQYIS